MGGMVLETNMSEIMLRIEEQNKIEKEEVENIYVILLYLYKVTYLQHFYDFMP